MWSEQQVGRIVGVVVALLGLVVSIIASADLETKCETSAAEGVATNESVVAVEVGQDAVDFVACGRLEVAE
jgi:hypothetical protein